MKNEVLIVGNTAHIALTNCDSCAVVDKEDLPKLQGFNWFRRREGKSKKNIYAVAAIPGRRGHVVKMHRLILPDSEMVDHKDTDGLNNHRDNLRPATSSQNAGNRRKFSGSSEYKGVSRHTRSGKFFSWITFQRCRKYLGWFKSEIEAARAYDRAALELFGEFARLNGV